MAELIVDGDTLVVRLSALEKLGAMRGDVRVPLRAVRDIRVSDDPWSELRGVRAPGTGIPRVIALGTRRSAGTKDFTAVYRDMPGVVVELGGAGLDRLVVSTEDPSAVLGRVAGARSELGPATG
ncbi:MAG: hypothetical protein E6J03_07795 [Chloroflexi bacterium]|nr:MAG: hypothetical protein E6J03_07795 [Chloroflexota bacterium]